jgi:MFS family permease
MCCATVALLLALSWGGTRFSWGSVEVLGLVAGSVALWALFGLRIATAIEPLLPLSVLSNQVVLTGVIAAACAMGTLIGLSIQLPLYYESVQHMSASQSGLAMIPLMAGVVVGATATGRLMPRIVHYKRLPVAGMAIGMLALAVLTIDPAATPLPLLVLLTGLAGVGLGTVLPVVTVGVQNAVPVAQIGTATAAQNFFRSLGGAVLTAVFGAIVVGLAGVGGAHEVGGSLALDAEGAAKMAHAFRWVFAAAAFALFVGLVAMLIMEERPLRTTVHHTANLE